LTIAIGHHLPPLAKDRIYLESLVDRTAAVRGFRCPADEAPGVCIALSIRMWIAVEDAVGNILSLDPRHGPVASTAVMTKSISVRSHE